MCRAMGHLRRSCVKRDLGEGIGHASAAMETADTASTNVCVCIQVTQFQR